MNLKEKVEEGRKRERNAKEEKERYGEQEQGIKKRGKHRY